jgi:beta-glucosidase/6-phospho-beta-glucosidase/beta-galactosidase
MMFQSFFLAGFEGSTGYNIHRQWFDQIQATQHDRFVDEDYARLKAVGIHAVREAVRWPLIDNGRTYDFSSLQPFIEASRRRRIEIIYDLFHFGYPSHINLFSEDFPKRFADYCYAVARHIAKNTGGICYFTPINEPSYFSWAGGEVGMFAPHKIGRGEELKVQLIRAALAGIRAIRAACPQSRIVNVDPICRVALPAGRPEMTEAVESYNNNAVFQSWDMLSGRLYPELGGSPEHLDIVGINYYWTNQWEWGKTGEPLEDRDPRRWSLRQLVRSVWERYGAEMLITETSHVDELRPIWLLELADEVQALLSEKVPLGGVCLYPILGMPEWHYPDQWTQMGLWELVRDGKTLQRYPYPPMLEALEVAQLIEARESLRQPQKSRSIASTQSFF